MKVLIGSTLTLMKVGILAATVVAATFGLAQNPAAESASGTEIIFSYSSVTPISAPAIIVNPDGFPRDVYVWAINVKDSTGVSGFNIAVQYDEAILAAFTALNDFDGVGDKTWLESTNRSGSCIPAQNPGPGEIIGLCSTLTPPPPLGPTGAGLIGHLVLVPGSVMAPPSSLTFVPSSSGVQGTFLLKTTFDPDGTSERIPVTLRDSNVVFLGCADNSPPPSGDGVIDLPNDILGVILRFGMLSSDPNWSPLFDLNDDDLIDLPNDILGTILQFQLPCTQS